MNELDKKSILEMADGNLMRMANREMERVLDNILDPATKPTKKRTINITIELKPYDDRTRIDVNFAIKNTLAAPDSIGTTLCVISDDDTGEMYMAELSPPDTRADISAIVPNVWQDYLCGLRTKLTCYFPGTE